MPQWQPRDIRCVVFDFGGTLSPDHYFSVIPPGVPQWTDTIQELVFGRKTVLHAWMRGELTLVDVAQIVSVQIPLAVPEIVRIMRLGCSAMNLNPAVWQFAQAQRGQGRKTALVTANMDVFSEVVVPAHGLDAVFDVILNTADHHELDKSVLWDRAFELIGDGVGYGNSLLIEDGTKEPALFRRRGGSAYQYDGDEQFREWLSLLDWRSGPVGL